MSLSKLRALRIFVLSAIAVWCPMIGLAQTTPIVPNLVADPVRPGRLELGIWPERGWVVQRYQNLVEIRLPAETRQILPAADVVQQLGGYLSDLAITTSPEGLSVNLTLDCDCVVALAGDGQSAMTIDLVRDDVASTAVDIPGARASAPDRAPFPPEKSSDTALPGSSGVDVAAAREHLLAQLRRAAAAGFVEFEDASLSADAQATSVAAPTEPEATSDPADVTAMSPESDEAATEARFDDPKDLEQRNERVDQVVPRNEAGRIPKTLSQPDSQIAGASQYEDGEPKTDSEQTISEDQPPVAQAREGGSASNLQFVEDVPTSRAYDTPKVSEPQCFPNEAFAFADLVHEVPFGETLGVLRRQLVGEFDRPVEETAADLAKLYLAAEFTAEVRAVLSDFPVEPAMAQLYLELAQLLDGDELAEGASIMKPDCVGDQAVWRALAHARAGNGSEAVRTEAISGRALERLPIRLRELVAAWIGDAAADEGDWDAARRMEAMAVRAARSLDQRSGRSQILSAKLADWYDEPQRATELLTDAWRSNSADADDALMILARRTLRNEHYVGADTSALRADLAALSRSKAGSKIGQEAFELETRLQDRVGTRRAVIGLLAHGVEVGLYPEDQQYALMSDIVTRPSDDEFSSPLAVLYMDDPERFKPALTLPGFRRELAKSMAALGVPKLAADVLEASDYADAELTETIANAFLQADDPRQAIEIAGQLPDGRTKEALLGRALMQTGMLEQAQVHLAAAGAVHDGEVDPTTEILDQQVSAALSAGDLSTALAAREKSFDNAPDVEGAEELAMLALEAGRETLPAQAASFLADENPARLDALNAMFQPELEDVDLQSPEKIADYLERLDAEESAILEMLSDG
jgi:hypothetical protein